MAKQKGLVPFTGTMGGINFYYLNGKPIARAAGGGFTTEANKSSPKMERARETAGEFGMVSKAKKLFKMGLHPFLMDLRDVTLHHRMMSLFQAIKALDATSERGKRTFQNGLDTAEGRSILLDFPITHKKAGEMLPGIGHFDNASQSYIVNNIKIENLQLPKGATGMQLCLGVLVVDFEEGKSRLFQSDLVFIDKDFNDTTIILTPNNLPTSDGLKVAVLQVRFYQEVNGQRALFKELKEQGLEFVGVY